MHAIKQATTAVLAAGALAGTGCLGPLVSDAGQQSPNLLPAMASVLPASDNPDLKNQIIGNDGLDARALMGNGGIIPLNKGSAAGNPVMYWNFGPMTRAPSPLYKFVDGNGKPLADVPNQLPLVDALPGDPAYSGVHSLFLVTVSDAYLSNPQLITSSQALADAITLGLVAQPMAMNLFEASPIVLLPSTTGDGSYVAPLLQVQAGTNKAPTPVFGDGFRVGMFELDVLPDSNGVPTEGGVQPSNFILPAAQVSYLRGQGEVNYNQANNPIFQDPPPPDPVNGKPPAALNYTPLVTVVDVDVNTDPTMINDDSQLYKRAMPGGLTTQATVLPIMLEPIVTNYTPTATVLLLPLQAHPGQQ